MKKLFFYAAAALAMFASCKKAEINEPQPTPVDDNTPVAMQFNVNAPSFEITKTKAAVEAWDNTEIFVSGYKNDATTGYEALFENYKTNVVDAVTPIEVYQTGTTPYYYAENTLYDFFGYHLGGATIDQNATITVAESSVSFDVTFDGSNDLMYATTNKDEDILKDITHQVTTNDVYSAWAARRDVQPTLVFEHALTRFNFYVKGMNEKSQYVTIDGISAQSVNNGTLTVVSKTALGFVPAEFNKNAGYLKLNGENFVATKVIPGATFMAGGEGASLMVAPGMSELNIKVEMSNNQHPTVEFTNYEFTAKASDVRKKGLAENAGISTFEAGTSYNIYINVYGPEEIVITAELTPWAEGGDYTYDPDQQSPSGTTSTYVNAELTSATAGTLAYSLTTSDDVVAMQAALKDKDGTLTEYKDVALTKAQGATVEFTGLTVGAMYSLVVKYKTDLADDYTLAANVEIEASADVTTIEGGYYISDKEAFESHCSELTWYEESTPQSLPWLAVGLAENGPVAVNVVVENETNGKYFTKTFNWTKADGAAIKLITISEEELGRELTPGNWIVTVNGAETTIVVPEPAEVTEISSYGVVTDKDTFNTLCAHKLTWYDESTPKSLPWLVANFSQPVTKVEAVVKKADSDYEWNGNWEKESGITMITISNREDELNGNLTAGKYIVTYNGVEVEFVVPETETDDAE